MPELPEVEILARHLRRHLLTRQIQSVALLRCRRVESSVEADWNRVLRGARVEAVRRRGKYILIETHRTGVVSGFIVHLGMTGRVGLLADGTAALPKHTVAVFQLDGERLVFSDARGFGRLMLGVERELALGVEPLDEPRLPASVARAWRRSRSPIKPILLDQAIIAGIGNIYAGEALFVARIAPQRTANSLTAPEARRLWSAIRRVLRGAVRLGERLALDLDSASPGYGLFYFGAAEGSESPVERFRVYDRAGEPCDVCGSPIERSVMAARPTYFCARCHR